MHWDINELNKKYNQLLSMYNKEKKPLIKEVIHDDICSINMMRSLYYPGIDEYDEIINNYKRDIPDLVVDNYSTIIMAFNEYAQLRLRNRRKENVAIKDYNLLILNFIYNYYPELFKLYKELVHDKKIELNNNRSFAKGYNGQCIYNITLNEIFLYARYNNTMFSSLFLPHELGHAYQAYTFPTIEDMANKNISLFSEVYSTYIELLYIKYLKDLGYNEQAKYLEKRYWVQYTRFAENQLMYLFNQNSFLNSSLLECLFSMGLSNIFYEDYLKTNNHHMLDEFNELYKRCSDQTIIKEYSLERILESPQNALKRIL